MTILCTIQQAFSILIIKINFNHRILNRTDPGVPYSKVGRGITLLATKEIHFINPIYLEVVIFYIYMNRVVIITVGNIFLS